MSSRTRRWRVAAVILSLIITCGVLEGLAYVWERAQLQGAWAWELVASRRLETVDVRRPTGDYTVMKPHAKWIWGGIDVTVNSDGLRAPEVAELPRHALRILNLGDSVAMGWGVSEVDTYGRRLESRVEIARARRVVVTNAGVPVWNPQDALAFLLDRGHSYEPDLVLFEVTISNDIVGRSALEDRRHPLFDWLRTHTYLWPFVTVNGRWVQARLTGRERISVIDPRHESDFYFPLGPGAPQYTDLWDTIIRMRDWADTRGAEFLIALFPTDFQVVDPDYPTTPQDLLTQWSRESGMDVVDLLPTYQAACRAKPGGPCEREDRYLFADLWMHPSRFGHELAAEQLAPVVATLLDR